MRKYLTYFNERFPFQTHLPIIGIFTFSAICFSLSAAGETDFVPWYRYLLVFCLTFGLFLLLRISDEFTKAGDMWRASAINMGRIFKGRLNEQKDFEESANMLDEIAAVEKQPYKDLRKLKLL